MKILLALAYSFLAADASPLVASTSTSNWARLKLKSLVSFGDSYTDDSRLWYFLNHGNTPPPVGWVNPPSYNSADGGRPWVQYVHQYTGCAVYNYAVGGAVCSKAITPVDFPDIATYEVSAFTADKAYTGSDGKRFLTVSQNKTAYAIWIGTNDLGVFVRGQNDKVGQYIDCVYDQVKRLYDSGARYFVILNVSPLDRAPEYAAPPNDVGANQYWADKPADHAAISDHMKNLVASANAAYDKKRTSLPGAEVAVFDVHSLLTDVLNNGSKYLNGSAEANTTGYANHCSVDRSHCVRNPSPDSFAWYDELHVSEQAERIVAKNFLEVIKGSSKYAKYWSG
ncbi:carbohydrate esterase family 16 protein [Piedraia hortae CBS 480.64]|uniref:Carbohydrate esterase family 16 protein n=1 Tax=Piedraia hortae CBS 480.64 TaxID=1314780 RepID=A0A6A7CC97_9PEZI|nr:carbohydrate esterase family 16 protein [Piedraia hortae CBS 480.64]